MGEAAGERDNLTWGPGDREWKRSRAISDWTWEIGGLARLARRFGVAGIVVGNPLHLSGEVSPQAAKTQAFAAELGELTGLPIHLWDERLTTREAHRILYEAGHARQEHKRVVDQVAAALVLQEFLEQGLGNRG